MLYTQTGSLWAKGAGRRCGVAGSSSQRIPSQGLAQRLSRHARFASSETRSVAVIGAGLSGLSHALFLARGLNSKQRKTYKIVVYEANNRTGGWVDSKRIEVEGSSTALIEKGPRSIRAARSAAGYAMLELITSLGLGSQVIDVSKEHPSAKNRLLYFGGALHFMPYDFPSLYRCLSNPGHVLEGFLGFSDILTYVRKLKTETAEQQLERNSEWHDESIEDLANRVFDKREGDGRGTEIVDRTASAFLHGVYAADASQISVRATLPFIHNMVTSLTLNKNSWWPPWPFNAQLLNLQEMASRPKEFPWARRALRKHDLEVKEQSDSKNALGKAVVDAFESTSVLSFQNGVQTLTDAIRDECLKHGVEIRLNSPVKSIDVSDADQALVKTSSSAEPFDRVVATLPSSTLSKVLNGAKLPNLSANPSTTVCVINVVFPKHLDVRLSKAFGFLMPRIVDKEGNNKSGLLGVVFDSEAVPGQDEHAKVTMMFGGPYWKDGYTIHDIVTQKADGKEKAQLEARRLLDHFISHAKPRPDFSFTDKQVISRLHIQRKCIPTYTPGHPRRMYELHESLCGPNARPLSVLGASYTGVSVNDCVLFARRTANRIVEAEKAGQTTNISGLEEYLGE